MKDPKFKISPLKEAMSYKDLTHEGKIIYVSKKIKSNNKPRYTYKSIKHANNTKKNVRTSFLPWLKDDKWNEIM